MLRFNPGTSGTCWDLHLGVRIVVLFLIHRDLTHIQLGYLGGFPFPKGSDVSA